MLQHDYIIDLIQHFCAVVLPSLRAALLRRDRDSVVTVERAVGQVLDLDPDCAMSLSPESLVTMMQLSGVGESVAGYVAYALNRVGDAYESMGDATGATRHAQAAAVASAFHWNLSTCPEEFEDLERELKDTKGLK
jgi:hypothetical protein